MQRILNGHDQIKNVYSVLLVKNGKLALEDKLSGKSDDDEENVELFPETESQVYGTSQDIGGFKLKFVKNRESDINHFVLHCAPQFAFMSIPFDKIK